MPRSASERLTQLEEIRDALDDALLTGASDVIRYRVGNREVQRSRSEAVNVLAEINQQISALELAVNGRARNRIRLQRYPE
jgi:chaperonin cofactor prefoldin